MFYFQQEKKKSFKIYSLVLGSVDPKKKKKKGKKSFFILELHLYREN